MPEEKEAIEQAPTGNIEAYTHYLRGRQLFNIRTRSALRLARQMFSRAVELDSHYARAYAGLADCDSALNTHGGTISFDEILATAGKALEIDPNLAEAHAARGYALTLAERRAEAAVAFEQALSLDPNCYQAHDFYAHLCVIEGRLEEGTQHYLRALEIQPDDYASPIIAAMLFRSLGRPEEEARYARLGVKRAEEALRRSPEDSKPAQLGATALVVLGERERAKDWLERSLAIDPDDNIARYNAACTYSLLGEIERAIAVLETLLPQANPDMWQWLKNDADLDPIRSHPRYQCLLEFAK